VTIISFLLAGSRVNGGEGKNKKKKKKKKISAVGPPYFCGNEMNLE